jgi:peptidoglycan LD-endopeptidase LytH
MAYEISLSKQWLFALLFLFLYSCKTSGPGIFGKKSLHEQYSDRIINAGLRSTVLGSLWFGAAEQSVASPVDIPLPYRETGYFAADKPSAAGFRFSAQRGQKLVIVLDRKPTDHFTLYIDLWKVSGEMTRPKHIAAADTSAYTIQHEVDETSNYILRLQPELLSSGEYTIAIHLGPSLAYPIKAPGKDHIKSLWGTSRDGGIRRHEGIDMFAPRRTPVIAAANGRVTGVSETGIGGKVIWLRAENRDYALYYAHLDSQMVKDGDIVQLGDTIGLMGNTGNAKATSPHLHFGIYSHDGPVDPLPFVNPEEKAPEKVIASTRLVGHLARTSSSSHIYSEPNQNSSSRTFIPENTLIRVEGATSSWYKISLPDDRRGFLNYRSVNKIDEPVRSLVLKNNIPIRDEPDSLAAKKTSISAGETVDILAAFNEYYFISIRNQITGWIAK